MGHSSKHETPYINIYYIIFILTGKGNYSTLNLIISYFNSVKIYVEDIPKMPAVGNNAVYELVVEMNIAGNQLRNVFYYWSQIDPAPGDGSDDLNAAFESTIIPLWQPCVSDDVSFTGLNTRRLNNLTDFNFRTISALGGNVGTNVANFVAATIRLIRQTKETRNGSKRIGGLTEDLVVSNRLETAAEPLFEALGSGFTDILSGGGFLFNPVIVGGKRPLGVPAVEADWIYNLIVGHEVESLITSQRSRRVGIGI